MKNTKKMSLVLYNTMGRQKMEFFPIAASSDSVGMYTCGPTVYNYAHIGNLRTYVFEDILKRTLIYNGYQVKHVMNITDVGHLTDDADQGEDKMEVRAQKEQETVWQIAEKYTKAFQSDMLELNILPPDIWCKATDHIQEQIAWIQKLEQKGITYRLADGIYFDTARFPRYREFAQLDMENLMAGARVEMVAGKRNPTDFALWKFSPENQKRQMEWDSPWGKGFPGWHIECSAMSVRYLGEQFEIHCGGIDHVRVHHTNEVSQVEAVTEKTWVKYWLHGEFLNIAEPKLATETKPEEKKMSKSGDNFLRLQLLKDKGFQPLAYRYFLLQAHYRKQLVYSTEAMGAAQRGFINLRNKVSDLKQGAEKSPVEIAKQEKPMQEKFKQAFLQAINDDLNMPAALAVLSKLLDDNTMSSRAAFDLVCDFDRVAGLNLAATETAVPVEIQELITERQAARKQKNWQEADAIRQKLLDAGYELLDSKDGVKVKKIR